MPSPLETLLVTGEIALDNRPRRRPLVPSGVFGMIVFIITEVMFFSALVSAYLIIRAGLEEWPPWGQPRLPIEATAFNTFILLLSAAAVYYSRTNQLAGKPVQALRMHGLAIGLGLTFIVFQGYEWVGLISFGLTLTSSVYGALFYLIIGTHAIHVIGALLAMIYAWKTFEINMESEAGAERMLPFQILWYFVVGIWPLLYILVYLL